MPSILDKIMGRTPQHPVPARFSKNAELGVFSAPPFLDSIPPSKKDAEFLAGTTVGWVYACANAISIEVASTNIKLMRFTKEGAVEVTDHPLLDLLFRVNSFTTAYDHWYRTQMFLEGVGEAPWYLQRKGKNSLPTAMVLLRPDRLSIVFDSEKIIGGYKYRKETGAEIPIDAKDIVFLRNPSVVSDFRGVGTLQAAAITVDSEEYAEKWNRNFFYNSARPDIILKTDQTLKDSVVKRMRAMWESLFKGTDNAHKMAILENGLTLEKLGLSQKDMDFLQQLKWSRDKILGIFQVPKSILGITEDVNRANAEAAYYSFARYTIRPRLERIVQQLNEFLVPQFGQDLYLEYQDPTPDNYEQRAAYMAVAKEWFTLNELRALDNLPPVRGGDTILRPAGLQPVATVDQTQPKAAEPRALKNMKARGYGKKGQREQVEEALKPLVKEIIKNQLRKKKARQVVQKSAENKDLTPYLKTDDERDAFQKFLNIKSVAQFESAMQNKASQSFKQQLSIVLENLETQNTVKIPKVRRRRKDPGDAEARKKAEELLKAIWDTDIENLTKLLDDNLSPIFLELVRDQAFNTANYLNLQVGDVTQDKRVADEINKMVLKLSGDVNETTKEKIREQLLAGIADGEGVTKLATRINTVFEEAGSVRAEMIARSESIRASNYAAEETYKAAGVKYKEWITASDERTCPFCAEMDGKQIKVGEDFWKLGQTMSVDGEDMRFNYLDVQGPPLHVNCRCTLGPVIET